MTPAQARRFARQLALPEIGPAGQERLARARVAIVGRDRDDLVAETAARSLAAAGVGTLRLLGARDAALDGALRGSNPDVALEREARPAEGAAWVAALAGVDLVVRVGEGADEVGGGRWGGRGPEFDDDALLRAAVRAGVPVVVTQVKDGAADVVAFRKHGPCPHAPLDVPVRAAAAGAPGPADVVAGLLAAAEALQILVGNGGDARARHLRAPLDGREATAQEIPWTPECFTCGGSGTEMSFA
jgi:molybdopterin/thiamine biosynthesis adenylyltransferase